MLNLWRGWWEIDFQVPERSLFVFCTNRAQYFYVVTVFPSSVHQFFIHPFSFYFKEPFTFFFTIAICIYLCFAGEVFRFLAFGFISHTTRISNNTSFLCKRLVVKNKFRSNFSRFTKLKGFSLLLKTWLQLIKNWKIKWWTQF